MKHVGLLVLGSFINSLGTGLSAFGLAVVILRTYGTASSVAAVQMSAFAPIVLLAPLAGVLADRYDRRLMMMIGDAGSILGLGVILAALSSPQPSLGWICAGAVISSCLAALTEPMAVALHAVRRSDIGRRDTAIVIGCGPVGLAVICHLKAQGIATIIASDFSPTRRALAARCGAHVVVDPLHESPYDRAARQKGVITAAPDLYELGMSSMEKLRKVPGWAHLYRLADKLGAAGPKSPVIFECVGVPGMIDGAIAAAPVASRVIVVGVCMGDDKLRPAMANGKEIDLRFVFGYTPLEFRDTLYLLADGKVDASALVTGTVGLNGVAAAFQALGDPESQAKILIDPRSPAVEPGSPVA